MSWQPEKQAGFLLAALLAEDRDLAAASPALLPQARDELSATVADSQLSSREAKAHTIAAWLRLLRPDLDASALSLPSRMRCVLARAAKAPLKGQLLSGSQPVRADFWLEPQLASAISRIAHHTAHAAHSGRL